MLCRVPNVVRRKYDRNCDVMLDKANYSCKLYSYAMQCFKPSMRADSCDVMLCKANYGMTLYMLFMTGSLLL